ICQHRRISYNTASDKPRLSRAPGNRIVSLYTEKVRKAPKHGWGFPGLTSRRSCCETSPSYQVASNEQTYQQGRRWFHVC
ncbi:unnamed protein product, partial [Gulo gulo]